MSDPERLVHEIRIIQQELVELQHEVIQGKLSPQEYQQRERDGVQRIHRLEERLAQMTGQSEPERETNL